MLKEGKLNNVNNFEKEYSVMKSIKDMSKNEKLKYMFKLLPKYWGDIDEELGVDRLRKALYYKTTKGKPIVEQLKEIKFDLTIYEDLERFLFLLTYIVLTHSKRKIVTQDNSKAYILPNQKLVKNIKDIGIDSDIEALLTYFLVIGNTYFETKNEYPNQEEYLIDAFNEHFFFSDRRFENGEYFKDKRFIKLVENKKGDKETQKIEQLLNIVAYESEAACYKYFRDEEIQLKNCMQRILKSKWVEECLHFIGIRIPVDYFNVIADYEEYGGYEQVSFSYIRCMEFMNKSFEICIFKAITWGNKKKWLNMLFDMYNLAFCCLDKVKEELIEMRFNHDIFIDFATHVYMMYYKRYYEYNDEILTEMTSQSGKNSCCSKIELKEKDNIIYSENYIINSTPKELLEYFIPDENERKPSDRNEIKNKLKYTLKVMDELENENPIFEEPRYAKYVRIMYFVIYGNYDSKYRIDKHMPKKLYLKQNKKIKNSESIILTERYMYERYANEGKAEEYICYLNKRKDLLIKCIEMLESVIEMKSDVKVEDKTEEKIDDR